MPTNSSNLLMFLPSWSTDKFLWIFILIMIIGVTLIGNLYIIYELSFRRCHRTRLHYFILNLAIGDLTICLCTMTSELFLLIHDQEWTLGNVACKLTLYIQVVTIASTTFINVAMTYDRYEAVCCPFRTRRSLGYIHRTIIICWLSSFIVAIPQLFIFEQSPRPGNSSKYRCASTGYTAEWQRRVYFTTFACYVLVLPAVCMTIWYARIIRTIRQSKEIWASTTHGQIQTLLTSSQQIRTVKLAMTIIIVFVVCWTPYMLITLIQIYSNGHFRIPSWLDGALQILCLHQSGLNPIIFLAFDHKRKHSKTLILAAALTYSEKFYPRKRGQRRERGGTISVCSLSGRNSRNYMDDIS